MVKLKNDLIVKNSYINCLKSMIESIEGKGYTTICPAWSFALLKTDIEIDCDICCDYFPKVEIAREKGEHTCPCDLYNSDCLIEFLKKVITNSQIKGD